MAKGALTQGLPVETVETDLYQTLASLNRTQIQKAQFVNTGGTPITIDVWITPDNSTATTDALKVISGKEIAVNETYIAIELINEFVNATGKVIAQASATGVSAWLDGNTFNTGA